MEKSEIEAYFLPDEVYEDDTIDEDDYLVQIELTGGMAIVGHILEWDQEREDCIIFAEEEPHSMGFMRIKYIKNIEWLKEMK